MRRAVGYVSLVLGWLLVVLAVALVGGIAGALLLRFGDVILWRAAIFLLVALVAGIPSIFLIRWARSALGKPGGSRLGRLVLGLVLLAFCALTINSRPDPVSDPTQLGREFGRGANVAIGLFGAGLVLEAWWHRASKVAAATLPDAPTARPDSTAPSDIALPEPPSESMTQ